MTYSSDIHLHRIHAVPNSAVIWVLAMMSLLLLLLLLFVISFDSVSDTICNRVSTRNLRLTEGGV